MQTIVECPYCHAELEGSPSLNGNKVECPTCKKSFVMQLGQSPEWGMRNAIPPTTGGSRKSQGISIGISVLALLIAIAALVLVLLSPGMPRQKFSKDAETSVRNHLAFQIEIRSVGDYFWRKNGGKILKSLDIKEIKTNGSWAVAFYKLSLGATEVKDVMFLYKTQDGYWIEISEYTAEKKCQSEWYKDVKDRIDRFKKDSGKFDVLDM